MALQSSVVTGRVLKWSINPISNPNPVYSHSNTWQYVKGKRYLCVDSDPYLLEVFRHPNSSNTDSKIFVGCRIRGSKILNQILDGTAIWNTSMSPDVKIPPEYSLFLKQTNISMANARCLLNAANPTRLTGFIPPSSPTAFCAFKNYGSMLSHPVRNGSLKSRGWGYCGLDSSSSRPLKTGSTKGGEYPEQLSHSRTLLRAINILVGVIVLLQLLRVATIYTFRSRFNFSTAFNRTLHQHQASHVNAPQELC
jgi:hypothetical protein